MLQGARTGDGQAVLEFGDEQSVELMTKSYFQTSPTAVIDFIDDVSTDLIGK